MIKWCCGLAALVVLLGGCGSPAVVSGDKDTLVATSVAPFDLPEVNLIRDDGTKITSQQLQTTSVTLLFFGFTNCADLCPLTLNRIAGALRRLEPAERAQVSVVLVSTDPARDTPAALRAYLTRIDPEFVGVTGSVRDLEQLAEALGVFFAIPQAPGNSYQVDHSTPIIGLQRGGDSLVWTGGVSSTVSVGDLAADLSQVLARNK